MRRAGDCRFTRGLWVLPLAGALGVLGSVQAQQPAAPSSAPGQAGSGSGAASGQGEGPSGGRRGQFAGMQRAQGLVTAVSGATVTVKTEAGDTVQIATTDNTRVMKDRGPVKVTDLHPGDGLMAVGNLDAPNHTLHAAMIMAQDAAEIQAMRENLGKTYITGRVTAIDLDNAKMTVERPDHVAQTIGFDETTSFKRAVRPERPAGGGASGTAGGTGAGNGSGGYRGGGGGFGGGGGMGMGGDPSAAMDRAFSNGESITLADIKVGDGVVATGALKAGTFVPARLLDSPRRQRGASAPEGAAPGAPGAAVTQPDAPGPGTH